MEHRKLGLEFSRLVVGGAALTGALLISAAVYAACNPAFPYTGGVCVSSPTGKSCRMTPYVHGYCAGSGSKNCTTQSVTVPYVKCDLVEPYVCTPGEKISDTSVMTGVEAIGSCTGSQCTQ